MWDLTKTTTAQVYQCDLEYGREHIPGASTKDHVHTAFEFYAKYHGRRYYDQILTEFFRDVGHLSGMKEEDIDRNIEKLRGL